VAAPPAPSESNGYLRVRCNGGLNQQRSAVCILFSSLPLLILGSFKFSRGVKPNKYVSSIIALLLWFITTRGKKKKKKKGKEEVNKKILHDK
jgi:hypothetical protein